MTMNKASTMEEAIKAVLHEAKLTPENREILEKAVMIARNLQKAQKHCGVPASVEKPQDR